MDEGIKRLRLINEQKAAESHKEIQHAELVDTELQTQEVILKAVSNLVDFLDNRISKTEVVNQLTEIATPDAYKVVEAIDHLHATLRTHENTDLTEVVAVLVALLEEAKALPKALPDAIQIPKPIDHTKQFKSLEDAVKAVEKVVKAQKLVAEAPIVKLPPPQVKIEKPDLTPLQKGLKDVVKAVQGVVIPEYKTDNKEVEKLLKKTNTLLADIYEKPTGGGGGGGFKPGTEVTSLDPVYKKLIDDTTTANVTYIGEAALGTATSAAGWRIQKIDETGSPTSITWSGTSFTAEWDERATSVVYT